MAKKDPPPKRLLKRFDNFQQAHSIIGFPYAVVKKYGDDQGSYLAALITYFGFLSLFPLLIVGTSILQLVLKSNEHLKQEILSSLDNYLPILGSELQNNVHSMDKAGLALAIGLLIALYGARGGADAFRHAVNHIWQVPRPKRPGFPMAALKSLALIFLGTAGLVTATLLSSFAASLGASFPIRVFSILVSITVLFGVLTLVFKLATAASKPLKDFIAGALLAAVGLQILQILGGYIITHQLKNLSSLYGTFALVLGILFWIYLQAQIILYAVEVDTVRAFKLWPRSLTQDPLTPQDKKAYKMYVQKERFHPEPPEKIDVKFTKK